jgi:hypothetical protein
MRVPAAFLAAAILLSCTACRTTPAEEEPAVWFVHATDPHLFYGDESNEKVRLRQEKLNQSAFSDLIRSLGSIPGMEAKPSFLLVTGDFGLDRFAAVPAPPAPTTQPVIKAADTPPAQAGPTPAERESAVSLLAETLKASPVKDIYLVLGNNDVATEAPSGTNLDVASAFLGDVQKRIAGSGVVLHDLTSCYRDPAHLPSGCSFDVPGTDFRLIGFSSFSFKNDKETYAANQPVQEAQMQQLATLVNQAGAQGKKVLIVTHIPEIDDPHHLAESKWLDKQPEKSQRPDWAKFSPWNVSPAVYQSWKEIVDSGTVAGVLAGHFHDPHKELYYRPYRWAMSPSQRADLRKLFLAPPLSVRYQDSSPIQARGFALFRLAGDQLRRRFFWFDPAASTFSSDPERPRAAAVQSWSAAPAAVWLWQIGTDKENLARAALVAIAFLAALLTVIATWEIPPASSRPSAPAPARTDGARTDGAPAEPGKPPVTRSLLTPFQGNFATTVLSGLGGMAAVSFVDDTFWKEAGISPKAHFLVLFVVFFFSILLLSALYQGAAEALRSRVVLGHRPPQWQSRPPHTSSSKQHTLYWGRRFWNWVLSGRQAVLIFLDTFFNVVQGRNQLQTAGFAKTILNLHWSQYRVALRVRESIDRAILRALNRGEARRFLEKQGVPQPQEDSDIRVNIGLLSEDNASVSYFSWERGSLGKPFDQHSVAWVSVASGKARWCKDGKRSPGGTWKEIYTDRAVLLGNGDGELPIKGPLQLKDYYQSRESPDYEAFVILPIPWSRRSETSEYQKAGVLISFRKAAYMDALWGGLEVEGKPNYDAWKGLLECPTERPERPAKDTGGGLLSKLAAVAKTLIEDAEGFPPVTAEGLDRDDKVLIRDPELQGILQEGLEVLGEALRYFSPSIFSEQILPYLQT